MLIKKVILIGILLFLTTSLFSVDRDIKYMSVDATIGKMTTDEFTQTTVACVVALSMAVTLTSFLTYSTKTPLREWSVAVGAGAGIAAGAFSLYVMKDINHK